MIRKIVIFLQLRKQEVAEHRELLNGLIFFEPKIIFLDELKVSKPPLLQLRKQEVAEHRELLKFLCPEQ